MDLLINDLSLHGQFVDHGAFRGSMKRIRDARKIAQRFGRELYCHRSLTTKQITRSENMQQAVARLPQSERRAIMGWLSKTGPFWEDERQHGDDDWYEMKGEIVTDSAVGETAYSVHHGQERGLVSFSPSGYTEHPLPVLLREAERATPIDVPNYWEPESLEAALTKAAPPLVSWKSLDRYCRRRFDRLFFAEQAFTSLRKQPFKQAVAQRVVVLLDVLQRLCACARSDRWDSEGNELRTKYFEGKKAWFTDSSSSEKSKFETELTFPHPEDPSARIFCPWHGKIKSPPYRLHFSGPPSTEPLYIVYIGPKLTKR